VGPPKRRAIGDRRVEQCRVGGNEANEHVRASEIHHPFSSHYPAAQPGMAHRMGILSRIMNAIVTLVTAPFRALGALFGGRGGGGRGGGGHGGAGGRGQRRL